MNEPIIKVNNLSKHFGPTKALKEVDLNFYKGEIRGLIGENGSGKSTITSIIAGMQNQTSGDIYYKGQIWKPNTMVEAQHAGISMVLQEANTIENCTVAENIFAGRLNEFSKFGFVDVKKMYKEANHMLKNLGINHIEASDILNKYNFEDRKLIEITRCISEETEVFIVDETSTTLSISGRKLLYKLIGNLRNAGKSVIFISHDIDEILEQCTHLTVLRDGEIIGHLDSEDLNKSDVQKTIRKMMVGRELGDAYYRSDYDSCHMDEVALEFDQVHFGKIEDFSLKLYRGQIIGFGGLSGSGMHEIARLAFGLEKPRKGSVLRKGRVIKTPLEAIQLGLGYISKNRDTESIILDGSIKDNIVLPSLSILSNKTFIRPNKENKMAQNEMDAFSIKASSFKQTVSTLSGGNKQKVSFSKWTARNSEVIIMDCPTRGVDVGVKQAMYQMIYEMKKQGKAILMVSEELPELIGMSDQLVIMKDYKASKIFTRDKNLTEHDIIDYMI